MIFKISNELIDVKLFVEHCNNDDKDSCNYLHNEVVDKENTNCSSDTVFLGTLAECYTSVEQHICSSD